MPYLSEKIKIAGTKLDRRVKLSPADKEKIFKLRGDGWTIRAISRAYPWVSRRLIQFTLYPERLKRVNYSGHYKKYKASGAEWAKTIREHRAYKQSLYIRGLISLDK